MPLRHGPVRARDLRANIAELGFEKGIVETLERALEELGQIRIDQRSMTEMLSQCIDQVGKMVHIGGEMQIKMDQLKRDNSDNQERHD